MLFRQTAGMNQGRLLRGCITGAFRGQILLTQGNGKESVRGAVKSGFAGVLNHSDNHAHGHHLHGDVITDPEKRARPGGISISDPPAMPPAPQAQREAVKQRRIAVQMSMFKTPPLREVTADKVSTLIVMAAPAMLTVAPRGIEMELMLLGTFMRSQSAMFTGMLAAELRVKKA